MRIDPFTRRRGEIGMEAMLVLPVALIVILLARLILEGMLVRQEVAVFTRASTAAAAEAESTMPQYCTADRAPFGERPDVTQSAQVACREREAEGGLETQPAFWEAIRRGARPFARILRDVDQTEALMDMQGDGNGSTTFASPQFLSRIGVMTTAGAALFPQGTLWTHDDEPMRASYDPVIWDALREQGTWRLFPEVFPARDD